MEYRNVAAICILHIGIWYFYYLFDELL